MPFSGEEWFGLIFWIVTMVLSVVIKLGYEKRKPKKKVYNPTAL